MSERWIPVLAAFLGLLGGIGGAFIGGAVANEGQQQRFENEQAIRAQDLRREAFADFLQAVANVNQGAGNVNEELARADTAKAQVALFANARTREAASTLRNALTADEACGELNTRGAGDACVKNAQQQYFKAQTGFVIAAKAQLDAGE
jgi:hypothetical protein